jgi:hypothetical protein
MQIIREIVNTLPSGTYAPFIAFLLLFVMASLSSFALLTHMVARLRGNN